MFDVNYFKSAQMKICDVDLDVKEKVTRFQMNQKTSAAIVCKCT